MADLKVLFNELIRLEIELWDAVDKRLRTDCDLPLSRFEPMQVIARYPECRVQDIAHELAITVGGVSKLVDRIEASGHCRRRANPKDRRSSIRKGPNSFRPRPPPRLRAQSSAAPGSSSRSGP